MIPFIDEISVEDVESALKDMVKQDLIICYEDDLDRPLIQISDWWEWQTGLKHRSPSHFQAPPGWIDKVTTRDEGEKFAKQE